MRHGALVVDGRSGPGPPAGGGSSPTTGRSMFRSTLVAHHHLGELLLRRSRRCLRCRCTRPLRSTATRSADLQHLVELVGDDDDGVRPLAFMLRSTSNSLSVSWAVSTAVGSSRIRIFAPAVEHLDDLHASASRDTAMLIHLFRGSMSKPNFSAMSLDLARTSPSSAWPAGSFPGCPSRCYPAAENTSTSLKCWCTMPMPRALGVLGGADDHLPAVHQDGAAVRLVDAGQHVHQGGLARCRSRPAGPGSPPV